MPVAQRITETHIQEFIILSIKNVCSTMIRMPAGFVEKTPEEAYGGLSDQPHLIACVSFKGNINGHVSLCVPDNFAKTVAINLLGMTLAEVSASGGEVVRDVIGEITNMTAGGFKNALCDIGFPCLLTLPTVTLSDGLKITTVSGMERHVFQFECNGHRLVADIQMKPI